MTKVDLTLGDTALIIAKAKSQNVLRNQLAYILATARWETAHTMKPVREAYWLDESWRRENLRYYPWYGRGYVQLTWEANYKRAGAKLDLDLTSDPDVVMEPGISASVLVIGMLEGWFTGKKLSDYVTLQKSDFVGARRIVNGTDKASQIAALARDYDDALREVGYGVDTPPPPDVEPITHPDPMERSPWAALINAILSIFGGRK